MISLPTLSPCSSQNLGYLQSSTISSPIWKSQYCLDDFHIALCSVKLNGVVVLRNPSKPRRSPIVDMVFSRTTYIPRRCISSIASLHAAIVPKCESSKVKSKGLKLSADHGWLMKGLPDMYSAYPPVSRHTTEEGWPNITLMPIPCR